MYEMSSYMKTFFGSMYEISSCYDRGFLIDEIMLYLIMYELFHDPYYEAPSPLRALYAFLNSALQTLCEGTTFILNKAGSWNSQPPPKILFDYAQIHVKKYLHAFDRGGGGSKAILVMPM